MDKSLARYLNDYMFENLACRVLLQHYGYLKRPSTIMPASIEAENKIPDPSDVTDQSGLSPSFLTRYNQSFGTVTYF